MTAGLGMCKTLSWMGKQEHCSGNADGRGDHGDEQAGNHTEDQEVDGAHVGTVADGVGYGQD